jgi:hypothetical protein
MKLISMPRMKLSKGLKLVLEVARRQWQRGGGKTTKDRMKDEASSDDEALSIRSKAKNVRTIPIGVCMCYYISLIKPPKNGNLAIVFKR